VTVSLKLMANWILQVAHEKDLEFQEKVLTAITPALQQLDSILILLKPSNNIDNSSLQTKNLSSEISKIPSLFAIRLIFKLYNIKLNKNSIQFNSKNCYLFGSELAEFLLKNCQHLRNNKISLENPQSLDEYQNAIPVELYNLFGGIVEKLLLNRCQIANKTAKSRKDNYILKEVNQKKVQKISTMLSSIILTIGFTNTSFWLTQTLTSLCQKL